MVKNTEIPDYVKEDGKISPEPTGVINFNNTAYELWHGLERNKNTV